ncbi:MAG: M20/M25/M40 family metallo-hydrolase [Deltaproteobacteria bacterium]|nr:M20/M25/M40 family metallo-hydrolase [Deltaproteobacteria bacterium]
MSDPLSAGVAWLSGQAAPMAHLLELLVRQNSFTRNPQGVNAVADLVAAELARLGLAVERIPGARFGDHLAFAGPAAGAPAFLVGHLDTVFPPGQFEGWESDGRVARGPGVFDMKGGAVVMLFGLAALGEAGLLGRVAVRGMLVSDEEVGSPESQPLLRARAAGAACALVLESGREGDRIVTARKGVAAVRAEASGVAAHAGNDHARGRNAVWALCRFVDRAQGLTDHGRGLTVNVGVFQGGTTKNTVPDRAYAEVDLRFATPADGERLEAALAQAAAEAALPGTRIEVARSAWRDPMVRTEASAALAARYGACQRQAGLGDGEAPPAGGGSDACTTSAAGIPSIDGLGPRGSGYHTREERIELASLVPKAEALFRFLASQAGPASR